MPKAEVLRQVIYGYTAVTAAVGFVVWFTLRGLDGEQTGEQSAQSAISFARSNTSSAARRLVAVNRAALRLYSYKAFDQYALFAVRGHGIDEVDAAQMVAVGLGQTVAALGLGLLGDRFGISRMALLYFVLLIFSHSLFAFTGNAMGVDPDLLNTLVTCIAIFGLRGLYFGLLQEGQILLAFTGTAVGLVSKGYAPDIIAAVAGFLIDQPGTRGFPAPVHAVAGVLDRGGHRGNTLRTGGKESTKPSAQLR